jgi:pimeloyl-ACP methyl ester carboxylesterase
MTASGVTKLRDRLQMPERGQGEPAASGRKASRRVRKRWRLIGAAVVLAAALLVLNAIIVSAETRPAEVTHPRGQLLDLGGGEQQLVDEGPSRGRALVLLHCFVCSLHSWEKVADRISARERVLRLDLLGFGGSAKPDSGYAIADQADYLAAALRKLGVERTVVAGNSFGAVVATALAERHPELVAGVVLVDMAPELSYGDTPALQWLSYQQIIGQLLRRITPDSRAKSTIEDRLFSPGFNPARAFPDPERIVDDFRATTFTSYTKTGEAIDDYMSEAPLDERLAATGKPALVVFGSEDQVYPAKQSLDAYKDVPQARAALVPGAGHAPQLEDAGSVARLLLRFTRSVGHER